MSAATRTCLVLAACAGFGTAPSARANPNDYFGFGARAIGFGGAFGALADDFSANYYNPAGLATNDALQIELGYMYVAPSLRLNDGDLDVDTVHGFQGGLVVPGKVWGHQLGLSIGLHLPDQRVTRLRALPESQPRFVLYDNHPQRLVLTTSLGFEVLKDLVYVGIGLNYLSDTKGRLDVVGNVDLTDSNGTTLMSSVDVNFVAARYVSAGILVKPMPNLRIGLSFRDEFDLSLDIGVVVNGDIVLDGASAEPTVLVPGAVLTVVSENSNLFSPRQLSLSAAWTAPGWTLAAELTWQQWSRFRTPTAFLTTSLEAGPLPLAIPPSPKPTPPGFHDTFVPRIGGEVRLLCSDHVLIDARMGVWFEPSPAPAQTGTRNFVDGDKFGFGMGFSIGFQKVTDVFPRPFWLDVGGLLLWMPERLHLKSNPADAGGDYISGGAIWGLSSNLRFEF